eukprot:Awhi_evm1s5900
MDKELTKLENTEYECDYNGIVGSLQYLANSTRPDIALVVNKLSQHLTAYGEEHWNAALRIIKYLKGTINFGLKIPKTNEINIEIYTDASYGTEYDRRSRSGMVILVNGCPIVYESKRQGVIALSSAESEYIALCNCLRHTKWLMSVISQLFGLKGSVIVNIDNQPAKHVALGHNGSKLARHIDIRYHYVKEILEDKSINLEYCDTDKMIADIFTKPLGKNKFEKFRERLVHEF